METTYRITTHSVFLKKQAQKVIDKNGMLQKVQTNL
jgi:hypothetical protein